MIWRVFGKPRLTRAANQNRPFLTAALKAETRRGSNAKRPED